MVNKVSFAPKLDFLGLSENFLCALFLGYFFSCVFLFFAVCLTFLAVLVERSCTKTVSAGIRALHL